MPADAIHVEKSRMRGQAGTDSRVRVLIGPVEDFCQTPPIGLIHEVLRSRLRSGHDEAVEMAVPELIDAGIAAHIASAKIRSRNIWQCVERQSYHEAVGRRAKQRTKLTFGRFQRRVRHIVDEADIDALRVRFTELDRRRPVETFRSYQRPRTERLPTFSGHGLLLERWAPTGITKSPGGGTSTSRA